MRLLQMALICIVLVSLGSAFTITTDKSTYFCNFGKCDPVKITLLNDKLGSYTVKITMDTKTGTFYSAKLPYISGTNKNQITTSSLGLSVGTSSFYLNVSAKGNMKFNISVYDSVGKLVAELDPWFNNTYDCKREIDITNPSNNISALSFVLANSGNFTYGQVVNKNEDAYLPFYREDWGTSNVTRFMNPASNDKVFLYGCNNTPITDLSDPNIEVKNNSHIQYLYYGNTLEDYARHEGLSARGTGYNVGRIGQGFSYSDNYDTDSNYNDSSISANMKVFNFWWKPGETVDSSNSAADIKTLISTGDRGDPRFGIYIYMGVMYGRNVAGGLQCDPQTVQNSWTGGTWYNIAMVQNTTNCYFLVNGAVASDVFANTAGIAAGKIGIGSFASNSYSNSMKGIIDEVYISDLWEGFLYNYPQASLSIAGVELPPSNAYQWLNVSWLNPDFLNITSYGVNFSLLTTSSEAYINCSLNVTSADAVPGTGVHGNLSAIVNNSAVSWWLTMENGTYAINMSCYAGAFYNSTANFALNMLVPNVSEPEVPAANGTVIMLPPSTDWTYTACVSNISEYREKVATLNGAPYNYSEIVVCSNGCDINSGVCNADPYASNLNLGYLFLGILGGLALLLYINSKSRHVFR